MATDARPDRGAERALLTRARRGEPDALRGLVHRYASLVWGACALVAADEKGAARLFGECWEHIISSLASARRQPDLAGMILSLCRDRLMEIVPGDRVAKVIGSAAQLASGDTALVEAPPAAMLLVAEILPRHVERLERETTERRSRRRRGLIVPAALLVAIVAGTSLAYCTASRLSERDFLARCVRNRVVARELVPRLRDVVEPPFEVTERADPELRQYEQVSLVLEEVSNMPASVEVEQIARLKRRVESLDLIDFAARQAEMERGGSRALLSEVCLVLEEIANL